jgi:hypothetical protein
MTYQRNCRRIGLEAWSTGSNRPHIVLSQQQKPENLGHVGQRKLEYALKSAVYKQMILDYVVSDKASG